MFLTRQTGKLTSSQTMWEKNWHWTNHFSNTLLNIWKHLECTACFFSVRKLESFSCQHCLLPLITHKIALKIKKAVCEMTFHSWGNLKASPSTCIVVHSVGLNVDYKNVSVAVFAPAVEAVRWCQPTPQRYLILGWKNQDVSYLQYELLIIVSGRIQVCVAGIQRNVPARSI